MTWWLWISHRHNRRHFLQYDVRFINGVSRIAIVRYSTDSRNEHVCVWVFFHLFPILIPAVSIFNIHVSVFFFSSFHMPIGNYFHFMTMPILGWTQKYIYIYYLPMATIYLCIDEKNYTHPHTKTKRCNKKKIQTKWMKVTRVVFGVQ